MSVIRQKVTMVGGGGGAASSSNSKRAPILVEREETYGAFEANAARAQYLKTYFRAMLGYALIDKRQAEALDMIASKLARILTTGVNHEDNWLDISGYALLALEAAKDANKFKK